MTGYTRAGAMAHLQEQVTYQHDSETTVDTDALRLVLSELEDAERIIALSARVMDRPAPQKEYAVVYEPIGMPPGDIYVGTLSTLEEAENLQAYRKRVFAADEYVIWTRRKAGPWEKI